jgi:hypothetical protein
VNILGGTPVNILVPPERVTESVQGLREQRTLQMTISSSVLNSSMSRPRCKQQLEGIAHVIQKSLTPRKRCHAFIYVSQLVPLAPPPQKSVIIVIIACTGILANQLLLLAAPPEESID